MISTEENISGITLHIPTGLIKVSFVTDDVGDDWVWMKQNDPVFSRQILSVEIAPVLSLPDTTIDKRFPIEEVSTGLPFIIVPLLSRDAVRSARINRDAYFTLISTTSAKAVYVFCNETFHTENTLITRMFGDYYGVP